MIKNRWYEIRPYRIDDKEAGETNMRQMLSHFERFLLVVCRDNLKVRIFIRVSEQHRVTLDGMDGVEAVLCPDFDFENYSMYRKYSMRRHCAIPITPKEMERTSIYDMFNAEVSGNSFLALYVRRLDSAQPINEYIRMLGRGQSPDSMFRFFSSGSGKATAVGQNKIKIAQQKIQSGSLFLCKMFAGGGKKDDIDAIEGVFPTRAFKSKNLKPKHIAKIHTGNLSFPMFGASKSIVLSDVEMMGILVMPEKDDIAKINFEFGKISSKSAGLPDGEID